MNTSLCFFTLVWTSFLGFNSAFPTVSDLFSTDDDLFSEGEASILNPSPIDGISTPAEISHTSTPEEISYVEGASTPEETSHTEGIFTPEKISTAEGASNPEIISTPEDTSTTEGISTPEKISDAEGISDTEEISDLEGISDTEGIFDSEGTSIPEEVSNLEGISNPSEISHIEGISTSEGVSTPEGISTTEDLFTPEESSTPEEIFTLEETSTPENTSEIAFFQAESPSECLPSSNRPLLRRGLIKTRQSVGDQCTVPDDKSHSGSSSSPNLDIGRLGVLYNLQEYWCSEFVGWAFGSIPVCSVEDVEGVPSQDHLDEQDVPGLNALGYRNFVDCFQSKHAAAMFFPQILVNVPES